MTPSRERLLAFIRDYIEQHGRAPAYRKIAQSLGYSSVGTIHTQVSFLVASGHLIKRGRGRYSTIDLPGLIDLRSVPGGQLRAELARREASNG